jgi:hypothetical protein
MPPAEKDDKLGGSLSPIGILRKLDEVMFEVRAIKASLDDRKEVDKELAEIRHSFKLIKQLMAWVMAPGMAIVVAVVLAKFGVFSKPDAPPVPPRSGDVTTIDRQPSRPAPNAPMPPP